MINRRSFVSFLCSLPFLSIFKNTSSEVPSKLELAFKKQIEKCKDSNPSLYYFYIKPDKGVVLRSVKYNDLSKLNLMTDNPRWVSLSSNKDLASSTDFSYFNDFPLLRQIS